MKTLYYTFILFIISTVYLFSQVEENEIIKEDTVINIDSVVVTKIDTTIVAEPVNEQEKKDFIKHDFYKDYLASLKKTDSIDDCKKTGIISARVGTLILTSAVSVTWDIPINCKTNFATKYFYGGHSDNIMDSGSEAFSGFGFGIGSVDKSTNNTIKQNAYLILSRYNGKYWIGLNLGMDVIWKVFSVGLDAFVFKDGFFPLLTFGLNILY